MNSVLYYIIIIIVLYSIWTIIMEAISKKYSSCFCITLKTYIFAGVLAIILLYFHIKNGCKHHESLLDITKTPLIILASLILVAMTSLMSNRYWLKAVNKANSGYVVAMTNIYIVVVAILSVYFFKTKIKPTQYLGMLIIMGGCYLLTK